MAASQTASLQEARELQLTASVPQQTPRRSTAIAILGGLWLVIFFAALFAPSVLDDADATHANAARHMAATGDWVTLYVNGIRYLEKAPLPYWLVAASYHLFGINTFAVHLPQAIGVLLLALLGYVWAARAFGPRTGFYAGIATLTSAGVFLFTRIFIPEVLLSLFLCVSLYWLLEALDTNKSLPAYGMWTALALAVLTKGLVALVFFFGAAGIYLILSGELRRWRALRPFSGIGLLLAIAAPWHILAGLRNTGGMNGHGFFWFYFINEHVLRFLGKRFPRDYNKLPGYLFWSLHLIWLFPWSLFVPLLGSQAWRAYRNRRPKAAGAPFVPVTSYVGRTLLLLAVYAGLILVFFSISTNQEYYTFPAYLPMLMLLSHALTRGESTFAERRSHRWITFAHAAYTILGIAIFGALAYGLWTSRHEPFVPDIGDMLAHRNVGDYTLSMSHFFDLTGPSFAALRVSASLAALAFALGPAIAWLLRRRGQHLAASGMIAATSAVFLVAAHIALIRFGTMLSSENFAAKIEQLEHSHAISPESQIMLYGDQAYGSSIPFYLGRQVDLVEGRSTSMLFGSTFPDAPHIFLTNADLLAGWGHGQRKMLFVPLEKRGIVDHLLGSRQMILAETSGKALVTDRPLDNLPAGR